MYGKPMNEKQLDGRIALVTGASSGLGRQFALTLARAGAKVAVAARRTDRLMDLIEEISAIDGHASLVELDVTNVDSIKLAIACVEEELGAIAILVNNAGIAISKRAVKIEPADWDAVIKTNLTGAWHMATETVRHMERLGHHGTIINVASVLSERVMSGDAVYSISKAGVVQMTRALAFECARHNIRVNAISPGFIETDMNCKFLASTGGQEMLNKIPMRRVGKAEDLDDVLLLLAGDGSRYMTGSVITVDGGHSLALPS
jgi:NAD(P)-dependent dehydrogenase (short-subunit alcohol dehydrogenase family)